MKSIENVCFQGDVCFKRVEAIPEHFGPIVRDGDIVVAHSETGHHHVISDLGVVQFVAHDPLICYLQLESDHCDVVHLRDWATHETVRLTGAGSKFMVIRQREKTPEGWRRVED